MIPHLDTFVHTWKPPKGLSSTRTAHPTTPATTNDPRGGPSPVTKRNRQNKQRSDQQEGGPEHGGSLDQRIPDLRHPIHEPSLPRPHPREAAMTTKDEYCYAENCRHRHWRSGSMPTHRRGYDCPPAEQDQEGDTLPGCTGSEGCPAPAHQHGCFTDLKGHCNEPEAHPAEATTVSAEQIEAAAKDLVWHLNEWEDGQIVWDPSEVAGEIEDRKPLAELVFRAAGFRIEGDDHE